MSFQKKDDAGFQFPQIVGVFGTVHAVTAGSASTTTGAFGTGTTLVRVSVSNNSTHVHFAKGATPTATTSNALIPSGTIEYMYVAPGEKLAFLRGASADINVTVTELV